MWNKTTVIYPKMSQCVDLNAKGFFFSLACVIRRQQVHFYMILGGRRDFLKKFKLNCDWIIFWLLGHI